MTNLPKRQPRIQEQVQDDEFEIDLLQLAQGVLKRIKLCAAVCGSAIVCGLLYCFLATPIYQANCRILATQDKLNLAQGGNSSQSSPEFITTQIKLMTSEHILARVFKHFDFGSKPEFAAAREPLKSFEKKVKIKQLPNTSIIDIGFSDRDAELSAQVSNYLAQTFINDAKTRTTSFYEGGLRQLSEELRSIGKQRDEALKKINDFKTLHNLISVDTESSLLINKLKELQSSLVTAKQAVADKQAAVAALGMRSDSSKFSATQPAGQALGENEKKWIISQKAQFKGLQARLSQLEKEIAETETRLKLLDRLATEFKVLEDNFMAREEAYELAASSIAKLQLEKSTIASIDNTFQIIVPATKPNKAAYPAKTKTMIMAVLASGVLSVLLCVMLELMDKSLKTRQDFEKTTRLPVLGEIPFVGETARGSKSFITCDDPKSAVAESFRSLRMMLSLSAFAKDAKLIAITSPMTRESKSFVSLNLAAYWAQTGKHVLLIDSDLRHRTLTELLCKESASRHGLSDLLDSSIGNDRIGDLVVKIFDGLSLDFLPSGPVVLNPSELLATENTMNTFEVLTRHYDVVIVDTAPVLAFFDTQILSAVPSMSFLMVGHLYETPKNQMAEAVRILRSVNGTLIGTVIALGEEARSNGFGSGGESAACKLRTWYRKLICTA